MLRQERDYILRMIAAAAAAAARLRERLVGGAQPDEIVQAARAAQGELLGKDAMLLRALDPASAAHVLGDRERITAWVELLHVESEALRKAGREDEATMLDARAAVLAKGSG
jgi:hypothetical protein